MNIKSILLLVCIISSFSSNAQSWLWAKSGGSSTGSEIASGTTVDNAGNSYITGQFFLTTTFGSHTLTSAGAQDIFLVKYDVNGNVVWAKGIGGISSDYGLKLSTDNTGNIFVEGIFNDVVNFGNTSLTSSGWNDIFVAKYDTNGNEIWVKQGGGADYFEYAGDLEADQNGNVVISGSFGSTAVDFGSFNLVNTSSTLHFNDIFIVKYDAAVTIIWTIHPNGSGSESVNRMSFDTNGDLYVFATFDNTITLGNTTYTSFGSNDLMLIKYDAAGNFVFAKQMGGVNMDLSYGMALDNSNNIYITGAFYGTTVSFGTTSLTNIGAFNELFLVKLDSSGNDLWAKQIAASGNCVGIAVETDSQNNVYFACDFYGTTNFAGMPFAALGSEDVLIGKYSAAGVELWAMQAGGTDFDEARDLAVDQNGLIYSCGRYRSTANFENTSLTCVGNEDAWVAKLQGPSTASIAENNFQELTIYPNPADTKLNLVGNLEEYIVLNHLGQTIDSGTGNSLSTEAYKNGMYYLKIGNKTSKFSVQH